jgi:carbamate kinase
MAKEGAGQVPLDTCGANTQGAIGYHITQTLGNELRRRDLDHEVVAMVTQVVVDGKDPEFEEPSKPIGPFYSEASAQEHLRKGWVMGEDAGRGWRRLVPSPRPLEIIEEPAIRSLLERDVIVVAVGGGGVPVVRTTKGGLHGVGAVIDKDWASCLLAKNLGAEMLLLSTAVDKVSINFGTPNQQDLDEITVADARQYLSTGQFAAGSMKPKIEAAIDFLEHGGKRVVIAQPHLLEKAIRGNTGTRIVP